MNWHLIKYELRQFRSQAITKWASLTSHEPSTIAEQRKQLIDFFQEKYGYEKEQAESVLNKELSCTH